MMTWRYHLKHEIGRGGGRHRESTARWHLPRQHDRRQRLDELANKLLASESELLGLTKTFLR